MLHVTHKDYKLTNAEMPDCIICLNSFDPDDEIVVFPCETKHYFHTKCGQEWLDVKQQCPLCRHDFAEEIYQFIQKSNDIFNDCARDVAGNLFAEQDIQQDLMRQE